MPRSTERAKQALRISNKCGGSVCKAKKTRLNCDLPCQELPGTLLQRKVDQLEGITESPATEHRCCELHQRRLLYKFLNQCIRTAKAFY